MNLQRDLASDTKYVSQPIQPSTISTSLDRPNTDEQHPVLVIPQTTPLALNRTRVGDRIPSISLDKPNIISPPKTRTRDQLPEQSKSHDQKESNDDTVDKLEDEVEDNSSMQPRRSTRQRNKPPALNMNPNIKAMQIS